MLKATRRMNKRYILIEGCGNKERILKYLYEFFGTLNFGRLGVRIIKIEELKDNEKSMIIRVNRDYYYETLGALSLTNKKEGFRIKPILSSGTLKSLIKKAREKY